MEEEILRKNNQEKVLKIMENFTEEEKENIIEEAEKIDFEKLNKLYSERNEKQSDENAKYDPIDFLDITKVSNDELQKYVSLGENVIKNGRFAVITMAGGQGTRLGHNGPKGTFEFDKINHKSIFEVLCDKFKETYQKYGVYVYWYIMTSVDNNEETVRFFEENNYFGYPKERIVFFIQGQLPMLDDDGKLIIDENKNIKEASDGHGGVFGIIEENGILDDMKSKNIEWIYMGGVDNVLAKLVDPVFVGFAIDKNVLVAGKSLVKAYPEEKVGVFVKKNGRPSVVEYIDLPKEMSEERTENGELKYAEAHILCNLFNIKVLEQVAKDKLPYHTQYKKCNYINENGEVVIADKPNAYKFEAFLFDVFERLDDMAILRVKREEEFAPIKNAEGVDSPQTAWELYNNFYNNK